MSLKEKQSFKLILIIFQFMEMINYQWNKGYVLLRCLLLMPAKILHNVYQCSITDTLLKFSNNLTKFTYELKNISALGFAEIPRWITEENESLAYIVRVLCRARYS